MNRDKLFYAILSWLIALSACANGGENICVGGYHCAYNPKATAVGEPSGNAATAIIGAARGSLSSVDGKLTLIVPAGALSTDTLITIQPLTNIAHGRIGAAYRISSDELALL